MRSPDEELPDSLKRERQAAEARVFKAFRGVTRAGGVSWSESAVIDDDGTTDECAAARERDPDTSWEQLVDDPCWNPEPGCGGYSFLDAIGFRYYLPPGLIRDLRSAPWRFDDLSGRLTMPKGLGPPSGDGSMRVGLFTPSQCRAVGRAIVYLIHAHDWRENEISAGYWRRALDGYWMKFLRSGEAP